MKNLNELKAAAQAVYTAIDNLQVPEGGLDGYDHLVEVSEKMAAAISIMESEEVKQAPTAMSQVFKGADGLKKLAEHDAFWEAQPYGTRMYFGDGITEYLHRDVLRAAVADLAAAPQVAQPAQDEKSIMRQLADRIAASACPSEDARLEVAYAIARYLGLGWPAAENEGQTALQGWISVEDRLPLDDCEVLVATWFTMTGDQRIELSGYRAGARLFSVGDVTHWMPLPPAPEASV